MITHGSQIITDLRRGTWRITSMTRGTFAIFGYLASPYSAAATAALQAAFPTQWETIAEYGFAHPEIVPYVNAAPIAVGNFFAIADLIAVREAGRMTMKTLQDGSMWLLVTHHFINNGANKFSNATDAAFKNTANLFSIIKYLEDLKNGGKFEFLAEEYMTPTATTHTDHRWQQTSNPYTTTDYSGFVNISNTASGLINHHVAYPSGENANTTLLSYKVPAHPRYWYGAVGSWTIWNGGIPTFIDDYNTPNKGTLDFWIRLGSS